MRYDTGPRSNTGEDEWARRFWVGFSRVTASAHGEKVLAGRSTFLYKTRQLEIFSKTSSVRTWVPPSTATAAKRVCGRSPAGLLQPGGASWRASSTPVGVPAWLKSARPRSARLVGSLPAGESGFDQRLSATRARAAFAAADSESMS